MDLRYKFFRYRGRKMYRIIHFLLRFLERGDVTMKKYYIIYAVIGIVFLMSCAVLFLNPNSLFLNLRFHGYFAEELSTTSKSGDIAIFAVLVIAAIAAIACIVYHLYKLIRKMWLKAHNRKADEENDVIIPGVALSKESFKDLPEFSRLQFRAVGEDFEEMLEEDKDRENKE